MWNLGLSGRSVSLTNKGNLQDDVCNFLLIVFRLVQRSLSLQDFGIFPMAIEVVWESLGGAGGG